MMILRFCFPLLILTMACAALAETSEPQTSWSWLDKDGKPIAETSWQQSSGRLGAMLFFTADPDGLFERWLQPTPEVYLFETDTVSRKSSVLVTVVFSGCEPDNQGLCQLVVSYRLTSADGRELRPPKESDLWLNKAPPGEGAQQLAAQGLMYIPKEGDTGPIEVKAYVLDRVNNNRILLTRKLNIQ
jgi:hypothetical protein